MLPNSYVTDFPGRHSTYNLLTQKETHGEQVLQHQPYQSLFWWTSALFLWVTNRSMGEGSLVRSRHNSKVAALLETLPHDGWTPKLATLGLFSQLQAAPPSECGFLSSVLLASIPTSSNCLLLLRCWEGPSKVFQPPRVRDLLFTPVAGGFPIIPRGNVSVWRGCLN